MIVLDTTVLVYAVGAEHPLRQPCRRLIELVGEGRVPATTTVEVIQELTHLRSGRRGRDDAVAVAGDLLVLLAPLLRPEEADVREGLALFAAVDALGAFDAVLAVTARRRGAWALVSADRAFEAVPDLVHLDPASAAFVDDLLALPD